MEIKVRHPKTSKEITVQWDTPTDLDGLVKKYGPLVVANNCLSTMKVSLQSIIRGALGSDPQPSPKEIQEKVNKWKPGIRVRGKTPQEKFQETFAKMNPEQKKEMLRRLSAMGA